MVGLVLCSDGGGAAVILIAVDIVMVGVVLCSDGGGIAVSLIAVLGSDGACGWWSFSRQ